MEVICGLLALPESGIKDPIEMDLCKCRNGCEVLLCISVILCDS